MTEFVPFTLLFIPCILSSYLSKIFNNMHHTLHDYKFLHSQSIFWHVSVFDCMIST